MGMQHSVSGLVKCDGNFAWIGIFGFCVGSAWLNAGVMGERVKFVGVRVIMRQNENQVNRVGDGGKLSRIG